MCQNERSIMLCNFFSILRRMWFLIFFNWVKSLWNFWITKDSPKIFKRGIDKVEKKEFRANKQHINLNKIIRDAYETQENFITSFPPGSKRIPALPHLPPPSIIRMSFSNRYLMYIFTRLLMNVYSITYMFSMSFASLLCLLHDVTPSTYTLLFLWHYVP